MPAGALQSYERALQLHRAKQAEAAAARAAEAAARDADALFDDGDANGDGGEPLTPEYRLPPKLLNNAAVRRRRAACFLFSNSTVYAAP